MNLPDQVAVMPLPNAILFPRALLPLYIFEPRYRQMLADCLQGERMFSVALSRETGQPYPIAGIGMVRTSMTQPDGTSHLVLEGMARVEIVEYVQLKPYRIARVTPLESFAKTTPPREALITAVECLTKQYAKHGTELPKSMLDSLLAVEDASHLADLVSHTLIDDYRQKQLLLETLDVNQRIHQLVKFLEEQYAYAEFKLVRKLPGDLPSDHVGRN